MRLLTLLLTFVLFFHEVFCLQPVVYIEEDTTYRGQGIVSVYAKTGAKAVYDFELCEENGMLLEPFLADCASKIGPKCFDLHVFAIGDFCKEDMEKLFDNYFSCIELEKEPRLISKKQIEIRHAKESHSVDLYYQLQLVDWEMKTIHKLISAIAEKNVFELALEKKTVERKGKKIHHVHPLRFIGYIFSDPYLKKCMGDIKRNYFKWYSFVDGFSDKMKEEHQQHNLNRYVAGFAQHLDINSDKVKQYIDDKDYEGLLKFLL